MMRLSNQRERRVAVGILNRLLMGIKKLTDPMDYSICSKTDDARICLEDDDKRGGPSCVLHLS
jgi:hypothetical protein